MTTRASKADLIRELDAAVIEPLNYFAGPGQVSAAAIAGWGAWETLAHFPYWHQATAWGIASATLGGPPWLVSADADAVNALP